jgi:purine catabolism regulator
MQESSDARTEVRDPPDSYLAELEAKYQALVEQIPAVLYINDVDEDETTLYVSPQTETILGIGAEAWSSWGDRVHPDDHDRVVANYEEFKRNAREGVDEYRFIRPDGKEIWIHDRVTIIRDGSGEPVLVQGVMFDVTEQKEAQSILRRHAELLEKVDAIGRRFTDLVLGGADLKRVLDTLSTIVGNPVVLEDAAHQLVEYSERASELEDLLLGWAAHSRSGHASGAEVRGVADVSEGGLGCSWTSVHLHDEEWGRIHLLARWGPITEIDRMALDRAAAAVGLTLLAEREAAHLADNARAGLISDIWRGRWTSAEEVVARARALGAELADAHLAAVVVDMGESGDANASASDPFERRRAREVIRSAVREALRASPLTGLSALVGDRVLGIVGVDATHDLRAAVDAVGIDALSRISTQLPDVTVVIGVSRDATPSTLRRALTEASEAAAHGMRVTGGPAVRHFEDLGLLQLLAPLLEGPELPQFVEGELGPLLEHDAGGRTPLLPTLRGYLDSGGNKTHAAHALHLERRSLYYRLDKIERLLGRNLDDPATRLQLQVAVQGLDLLQQRASRPGQRA